MAAARAGAAAGRGVARSKRTGAVRQARGGHRAEAARRRPAMRLATALAIAFLVGALLGTTLALVSLLLPGVLPGTA